MGVLYSFFYRCFFSLFCFRLSFVSLSLLIKIRTVCARSENKLKSTLCDDIIVLTLRSFCVQKWCFGLQYFWDFDAKELPNMTQAETRSQI